MRGKIFRSIWFALLSVLTLSYGLFMGLLYTHFTNERLDQLRNENKLVAHAVSQSGWKYFDGLGETDFRITWITSDGTILYDNEADTRIMENHMEREEIRDALQTGYGESSRYSSTLFERQLYTAQRLPDGTVLRLSITQATIWTLFIQFLLPIAVIILAALALSLVLASSLSKRIVEPLNALDLDNPLSNTGPDVYPEIMPLLTRLDDQHKQLAKDREELEKASQIRQEFTANASHELKTPLHVISGYAELLESGMVPSEESRRLFAGKIRTESQRMSKLVEDIIDLSRLDSGGLGMSRELTDLYRIAVNAVESLESTAKDHGVTVTVEGKSTILYGIPHVLYSIIYNLCSNAIHYSNPGGRVLVSVSQRPGQAVLSVTDNGIGIPEEDLDRIFERFYRVDKSHSKEVGGTGLGLSIVKHAARIHDAQILVTSKLGEGSVFTVEFPDRTRSGQESPLTAGIADRAPQ
ncbi:MAG TPA: PAS domain-containing sensor histidine kinase [Lachnospiraceae bacterium]|nr:PAS domain-containing sensor histidine kinase [Lachnospiraceae bacterium]